MDFPPPEGPTMETFMPGSISNERSLKILTLGLVGYEKPTNMSATVVLVFGPYHFRILLPHEHSQSVSPLHLRYMSVDIFTCIFDRGLSI